MTSSVIACPLLPVVFASRGASFRATLLLMVTAAISAGGQTAVIFETSPRNGSVCDGGFSFGKAGCRLSIMGIPIGMPGDVRGHDSGGMAEDGGKGGPSWQSPTAALSGAAPGPDRCQVSKDQRDRDLSITDIQIGMPGDVRDISEAGLGVTAAGWGGQWRVVTSVMAARQSRQRLWRREGQTVVYRAYI
ncbi:hypothetical protein GGX14DRAFT_404381 [Mycena pura]|uniref:Uncharacterized protein n=1 Tax=Mycena pura TaxID=153505 RepID=A0AAD6UUA0_9AGAR|nr:hypothetical protein GGX14DRAFT_404381 [Mycena pura]